MWWRAVGWRCRVVVESERQVCCNRSLDASCNNRRLDNLSRKSSMATTEDRRAVLPTIGHVSFDFPRGAWRKNADMNGLFVIVSAADGWGAIGHRSRDRVAAGPELDQPPSASSARGGFDCGLASGIERFRPMLTGRSRIRPVALCYPPCFLPGSQRGPSSSGESYSYSVHRYSYSYSKGAVMAETTFDHE